MKLTDKIAVSPQAVARTVGSETVILDMKSGTYFGLDPVGTRIWQLMEEDRSLAEICDVLLEEFDVDREKLEADTLKLASDLAGKGLIEAA